MTPERVTLPKSNQMAHDVTPPAPRLRRTGPPKLSILLLAGTAWLAGCVSAPPPGPSILALPGSSRSPVQFQADDARCRASAASQAGLPANVAATDPTAGALSASQAAQERYNASYAGCMTAAGNQIPATSAETTTNPYAYGGYGTAANVPVGTATQSGPIYVADSGWGWGWGWNGWYGGLAPAYGYGGYGYGYDPWVPFGLSIGWGWGYGGWGYRGWGDRGWRYGGWGSRGGWGGRGWGYRGG